MSMLLISMDKILTDWEIIQNEEAKMMKLKKSS